MSLLDLDERIVDLASSMEIVRSPLVDSRSRGSYDVCLVEGGLCNSENVRVVRELRKRSHVLVAVGACALYGGIPALRNRYRLSDCLEEVYVKGAHLHSPGVPRDPELPLLTDRVMPVSAVVDVDFSIPGCPPPAEAFSTVLRQLAAGEKPSLPEGLVRYD
jgi:NAD-reducing hydrogenase small subunit